MTGSRRTTLVVMLVALAAMVAGTSAQRPVFTSKVAVVRVDVLVTENGHVVTGLAPSDFEVLDDGVPQRVWFAGLEQMPLNVTLALDTSASVAGSELIHLREASEAVLDGLTPEDRVGLLTFDHAVALRMPLTGDFDKVRQAVRGVVPQGETALIDSVYAGLVTAEADVGRKLLLVFTDGFDTSSYLTRQSVVDAARMSDVVVYAVTAGLAGHQTKELLEEVGGSTGGGVVSVDSPGGMRGAFVGILEEFRHRYLLSFTPSGVAATGWHKLVVRVKGRRVTVRARPGYQADF
jgi:VWFA-related protein